MLSLQEDGSKRKIVIKIEFTPLPDCNILLFLKGFQKIKMKPNQIVYQTVSGCL